MAASGLVEGINPYIARYPLLYAPDTPFYGPGVVDAANHLTVGLPYPPASLLLVLQQWGLLKFHGVGDPKYRGNALVLQTPHNTAVLLESATKVEWVVELWPRGYLQPPDVMTVAKWVTED